MHVLGYTKVQYVDHWSLAGCTISLGLMRLRPIENPCPDWNKHSRWADRPSQSWNCIIGLVLIPWGMQLSIWCHLAILVSLFLSVFRLIIRSVSRISFKFHVHLWSTAKLNCLSLRRWTTLAMPGWQATRRTPWMGTPTRAVLTSFWWNSMPRVSTCGRASAVVRAMTMLGLWRRTGCDVVFLAISCDIFHGAKLQNSLGGQCSESRGVASPLKSINLLCAFTRFDISYLVKCLDESRSDEFWLNRQSGIMSWMLGTWNS